MEITNDQLSDMPIVYDNTIAQDTDDSFSPHIPSQSKNERIPTLAKKESKQKIVAPLKKFIFDPRTKQQKKEMKQF